MKTQPDKIFNKAFQYVQSDISETFEGVLLLEGEH